MNSPLVFGLLGLAAWTAASPFLFHSLLRPLRHNAGFVLALGPFAALLFLLGHFPAITQGGSFVQTIPWVPALGLAGSLRLDGLSLLMGLLITGIGTLVVVYAGAYMSGDDHAGRFHAYLLAFLTSMLGVVLADNILLLFVFWEGTTITSFLLIGFTHRKASARAAALQALIVTASGGLAMLGGLVLIGLTTGKWEFSALPEMHDTLLASPYYPAICALILLGAFTKSAQFPFHFWLPNAMEAPAPVSSFLHSATMVKAGIYLMARLSPALGGTALWQETLVWTGAATVLCGCYLAYGQTHIKKLLAYSTVAALGLLTMFLGMGTQLAFEAFVTFLLAHALYKGALFMTAGVLDHEAGAKYVGELTGLRKNAPWLFALLATGGLSLAGFGPVLSFIGKEIGLEAALHSTSVPLLVGVLLVFAAVMVALALVLCFPAARDAKPFHLHHAPPLGLWLGPAILAALGILLAVLPLSLGRNLLTPAQGAVAGEVHAFELALWHGFTPALGLSLLGILAGAGLRAIWSPVQSAWAHARKIPVPGIERLFKVALEGFEFLAAWLTRSIQNGYLRTYVVNIITATVLLAGYTLLSRQPIHLGLLSPPSGWDMHLAEPGLVLVLLIAAYLALRVDSRLAALAALGVVGYGVSLVYLVFGAPELSMTQVLVDTLTVILFVLVFYHLPRFADFTNRYGKVRDATVATASGVLMTLLVLVANSVKVSSPISDFFVENSLPKGYGRNIVNVILVDFRALDTMGEISVLALAGIGVFALLRLGPKLELPRAPHKARRTTMILEVTTRFLMPLLLLFSIFLLFRGHNEPGGGFAGGLVAASAFALYAIATDVPTTRRALRMEPRNFIAAGLLMAVGSGILALLAGESFLTALWQEISIPGVLKAKVGTPILFDLGVYLVVLGVALKIILPLEQEAELRRV